MSNLNAYTPKGEEVDLVNSNPDVFFRVKNLGDDYTNNKLVLCIIKQTKKNVEIKLNDLLFIPANSYTWLELVN